MKTDFQYTKELLRLNEIFNGGGADNLRIVGGAVRNHIIGKAINDYDLSCKLLPEQSLELLKKHGIKTVPTGIKFGTIMAIVNGKSFEITTTRKDIKTDGRHAVVEFTDNFEEDAQRRDFTFNALYLDFDNNVYDYFNGLDDLQNGLVKFIGDAETRIKEDYLRILRFFRFYCYYGKTMDSEGLEYSIKYKEKLRTLSGERIKAEMFKILECSNPMGTLKIMEGNGILQIITGIKSLNFGYLDKLLLIGNELNIKIIAEMVLALMLNSVDELNILREKWRLSKRENAKIFGLIEDRNGNIMTETNIKKMLFDGETKEDLIDTVLIKSVYNGDKIENTRRTIEFIKNIEIPPFPVTGKDLQELGIANVREYGSILSNLGEIFVKSDFSMSKSELLEKVKY